MTAREIARRMQKRKDRFLPHLAATTRGLATAALRLSKERMTEGIYSQPVPTREQVNAERRHARAIKSGRIPADTPFSFEPTKRRGQKGGGEPAWRRTGHLRRSEKPDVRGPVEFAIRNMAAYAEPRHEAGKPNRRKVRYISHWQDEMARIMQPIAQEQWREAVRDVLKAEGV